MLRRLLSEPDVAFQGIWHRSYPGERPRCPAEKIFAVFLKINALLKWVFTTDTKCTDVFTETKSQTEDDGKVTSELMGILRCHSPLTPGKKTHVQPT